jgi:glycosyltransferase involved in cell wall biosynthesis
VTGERVAFDATPVISGRTGIARYVTELGSALEQRGVDLRRFAVGRNAFPIPPRTHHIRTPARVIETAWRTVHWPRLEQLVGDIDLVHATGLLMPVTGRPLVVTVHDIAAVRYPELHPERHVRQQRAHLDALHHADVVVTVSASTADDLGYTGFPADRIVVAPLGVTPLRESGPIPTGLSDGYLLTVGETSPRKRYGVVLGAIAQLADDTRLAMAGPPAGDDERLRTLVASLDLGGRVSFLGAVSEPTLAGLYQHALALCFPSVSEGFGLPVLEAMAAGVPVIAADIPVIRELAGDAVLYPSAGDAGGWAEAIQALAGDPTLRRTLVEAGRTRTARLTWDRTAERTLAAYDLALGHSRE